MYNIPDNLKAALNRQVKDIQYILEIEGVDELYGALPIDIIPRYGDPNLIYGMPGLNYGMLFPSENSRDYVNAAKSTTTVSQQMDNDKGAGTSTSSFDFFLVDYLGEISNLISPGFKLDEILGKKATVYFSVKGETAFPTDTIVVMYGIVETIKTTPGAAILTISAPQNILRQDFIAPWSSKLTENYEYKSLSLGGLRFLQTRYDGPVCFIKYTYGGAESVVINLNYFDVTIVNGVSTANSISNSFKAAFDAERASYSTYFPLLEVKVENETEIAVSTGGYLNTYDSNDVFVEDVSNFVMSNADTTFETHISIGGEILKVLSIDTNLNKITFDIVNRSKFGSKIPVEQNIDDEVSSIYVLNGTAIDIALKLMLSKANEVTENFSIYGKVPGIGFIPNAIYFPNVFIDERFALTIGDKITVSGLFTTRTITDIVQLDGESYLIVDGADIGNGTGTFVASFKSKYDVLPIGCGLELYHVDVPQFELIKSRYSSQIPTLRFTLNDSIDFKEFLEQELMFASGMTVIPRKGRISCNLSKPSSYGLVTLTPDNTLFPENRVITRSLTQDFYNAVKFYYNHDITEDKFLAKEVTVNADSVQRFGVGIRPLLIESKGIRSDLGGPTHIFKCSKRLLDRYKNAAESIQIKTTLGEGLPIEIGDNVVFGDSTIELTDITQGTRSFIPRIWEVKNKEFSFSDCTLTLLDTKYSLQKKYCMIAPSSFIGPGSTSTQINLKKSFGTTQNELETRKWKERVNETLVVFNKSYSQRSECVLTTVNENGQNLIVSGLAFAPSEDYIVQFANYRNDVNQAKDIKNLYAFFCPSVNPVSSSAQNNFTVSPTDIDKFTLGHLVAIHSKDYVDYIPELKIIDITSNTITLSGDAGFSITSTHFIELIGFRDGGLPYVFS